MPVEIKELHIKAIVGAKETQVTPAGLIKQEELDRLKKEITDEVIEKVFRIIRQKSER